MKWSFKTGGILTGYHVSLNVEHIYNVYIISTYIFVDYKYFYYVALYMHNFTSMYEVSYDQSLPFFATKEWVYVTLTNNYFMRNAYSKKIFRSVYRRRYWFDYIFFRISSILQSRLLSLNLRTGRFNNIKFKKPLYLYIFK